MKNRETAPPAHWYLEGFAEDGSDIWRTTITKLPFGIGRWADSDLVLTARRVSQRHATLYLRQDSLCVRDLSSTNGTFVNGERISEDHPLNDGDVIHFADQEFRLVTRSEIHLPIVTQTMRLSGIDLQSQVFEQQRQLREMLQEGTLRASFQPMVRLADGRVVAYEVLGRGRAETAQLSTPELFAVAETLGLENALSDAFRIIGLEEARHLPGDPTLFVNTHPAELEERAALTASLERLRSHHPERKLVLEIHERAVSNPKMMQTLSAEMKDLDVGLAFDDFGKGQTRLLELIDASPEYVKFDRTWIRDIHQTSKKRREMVQTLVSLVTEWQVGTIAEGIETAEEAEICTELGFEYAQGYFFGRPAAAGSFDAG